MEEEIKDQGLGIVHVASHTVVGTEAKDSFVLAHDGKITMDRLSQLVGLQQYRQQPLDLLTLSSCEIAAEDDRAALGLTGVAVKTGARTALASLWTSDDETTTELVSEFYRQLQDPAISKAVALQACVSLSATNALACWKASLKSFLKPNTNAARSIFTGTSSQ